jgi:1-acyl-sn-glycerol-3-phosphate acyltransferase
MITSMNNSVKSESQLSLQLWLAYFLLTIGILGFLLAYSICIPLYLLSKLAPALEKAADQIMQKGIALLMKIQPWYCAKTQIKWAQSASPGVLFVSNHRSHLDVFILLSTIPGIKILAKSSLFQIPLLNIMMKVTRQIPVPRGQLDSFFQAMQEVKNRLRSGEAVHVFPEMTRCTLGFQGVRQFSAAPFQAAWQENACIIPLVFKGTDQAWPKGRIGISFRKPIEAFNLEPVDPREFASAEMLRTEVQRRIEMALQ